MPGRHARARATALPPALATLLTLTVTACGGTATVNQSKVPDQRVDPALRALLPRDIRDKGSITSAVGNDYPPLSLLDIDNKTVIGAEPDLIHAVGQILGVRVHLVQANFDSIIGGVRSKRYDVAIQAMLDKKERQSQVTFVDYMKTSSSILASGKAAGNIRSLTSLCGSQVAVEQGTSQVDDVAAQAEKCAANGRPELEKLVFPDSVGCFQALSTGRADAFVGGTPTVVYQAQMSHGRFRTAGEPYRYLPYGILINKEEPTLVRAVRGALQKLIGNGTYAKILKQWNIRSGALKNATVNGGAA
ncbi:ABC transporter substrate-binding protein [Streptomyces iranensis]|uniref:Arginine/ornithine binding protein n=1 Tax=Streptomyces iranensis TaxID=576784 RepID=A0A061AE75_9ACTN|nr:ABC transporter substrate-binding protein [Streptomyces iranensis]MBP2067640.1 polar amino acid transport system substrate-binding protein [Streptomyces iranensis]CDR18197.1 arginine/ornithine binding protein [Streptomyces iranensis]